VPDMLRSGWADAVRLVDRSYYKSAVGGDVQLLKVRERSYPDAKKKLGPASRLPGRDFLIATSPP
jgi:hypothetical protein